MGGRHRREEDTPAEVISIDGVRADAEMLDRVTDGGHADPDDPLGPLLEAYVAEHAKGDQE